jgi:hypothetical protein
VKSEAKEYVTPHPAITVGLMATKLVALTRASLATPPNRPQIGGHSSR